MSEKECRASATELTPWVPALAQRKGEGVGGEGRQEGGEAGEGGMRAER